MLQAATCPAETQPPELSPAAEVVSGQNSKIESLEKWARTQPQVQCQLLHHFGPHVYVRELRRKPDTFIIGHEHRTSHLCVLVKGRLNVFLNGEVRQFKAGDIFISEAGRKMTYTPKDAGETVLISIHPTDETDLDRLDEELVIKSDAFLTNGMLAEAKRLII